MWYGSSTDAAPRWYQFLTGANRQPGPLGRGDFFFGGGILGYDHLKSCLLIAYDDIYIPNMDGNPRPNVLELAVESLGNFSAWKTVIQTTAQSNEMLRPFGIAYRWWDDFKTENPDGTFTGGYNTSPCTVHFHIRRYCHISEKFWGFMSLTSDDPNFNVSSLNCGTWEASADGSGRRIYFPVGITQRGITGWNLPGMMGVKFWLDVGWTLQEYPIGTVPPACLLYDNLSLGGGQLRYADFLKYQMSVAEESCLSFIREEGAETRRSRLVYFDPNFGQWQGDTLIDKGGEVRYFCVDGARTIDGYDVQHPNFGTRFWQTFQIGMEPASALDAMEEFKTLPPPPPFHNPGCPELHWKDPDFGTVQHYAMPPGMGMWIQADVEGPLPNPPTWYAFSISDEPALPDSQPLGGVPLDLRQPGPPTAVYVRRTPTETGAGVPLLGWSWDADDRSLIMFGQFLDSTYGFARSIETPPRGGPDDPDAVSYVMDSENKIRGGASIIGNSSSFYSRCGPTFHIPIP